MNKETVSQKEHFTFSSLEEGLDLAFYLAERISDGHFTLLKFTSNWRAGFTTPEDRDDIGMLSAGDTAIDAIEAAISKVLKECHP